MIKCRERGFKYDTKVTFPGIIKENYHSEIAKINKALREEMQEHERREIESIEAAERFVTTVNY